MEASPQGTRISQLEGQWLGPYQIVELIGRGGMAFVYKAMQPTLRRHVAVKVLPPYFAHEENFRARFQQEAETVARLEHPNILPIYDYGQQGDVPYIVMPLISGGTLRDWLARGVPLSRALTVLCRILEALDYAHAQGVVHRDIKPSNVLMSQGDWPLLTDFGIAKLVEPTLRMTKSGTMIGTPEYMAPEQSQATTVDHRADIYAMGVVLYEVLTGRLPFQGPTPVSIILQHVKDPPPPPSRVRPDLPPVWDDICGRALAKDPRDRFPTAGAMEEAIQAVLRRVERESGAWPAARVADPQALMASAVRARGEGDWQRVISLCGQLLEIDPVNDAALRLLSEAHEALRHQREQQQAERGAALLRQGEAALAAERFTEAAQWFEQARAMGVAGASEGLARVQQAREAARLGATYEQGVAALRAGDWERAVTLLREVTRAAPGYRDAAARLVEAEQGQRVAGRLRDARTQLDAGRAEEAARVLETVVREAPLVEQARTMLAEARQRAAATQPRPAAPSGTWPAGWTPRPAPPGDERPPAHRWTPAGGDGPRTDGPPLPGASAPTQAAPRTVAFAPSGDAAGAARETERGGGARLWVIAAAAAGALLLAVVVGGPRLIEAIGARAGPAVPTSTAVPTPTPPREPTAAELFPACQSAVAAAAWEEAIAACERVRAKDATFAGLADALATAYVNHGKQRRDQAEGLPAAIEAFDKALAVKPDDPEALKQRQLAIAFQEGEAALAAGDFAGAVERWQEVFGAEPGYREAVGDGGVRDRLYRALLGGGQAALEAGRYAEAQQQCERALELVGDSAEAQACRQAAIAAQRPPTVAPTPPAPRPQPTQPPRQPAQPQPTQPPRAQPTQPPQAQPTQPRAQPTQPPAPPTRAPAPVQAPPTRPPY